MESSKITNHFVVLVLKLYPILIKWLTCCGMQNSLYVLGSSWIPQNKSNGIPIHPTTNYSLRTTNHFLVVKRSTGKLLTNSSITPPSLIEPTNFIFLNLSLWCVVLYMQFLPSCPSWGIRVNCVSCWLKMKSFIKSLNCVLWQICKGKPHKSHKEDFATSIKSHKYKK